jgi:hypothetical protein
MGNDTNIISPKAGFLQYGASNNQFTWIVFEPLEIIGQTVLARKGSGTFVSTGVFISFLAPNELMETMTHSWEDYESMGGRLTQMIGEYSRFKAEGMGALKGVFSKKTVGNLMKGDLTGAVNDALTPMGGAEIVNYRVDSSLQYKTSTRRDLSFQVTLAEMGNPYEDVVKPVRMLQLYSAPTRENDNITIKIPYAFKISMRPGGLLLFKNAVIKTISPVWKGPYISGVPSSVQLQLSIQELDPLYDDQYTDTDRVKVRTKSVSGGGGSTTIEAEKYTSYDPVGDTSIAGKDAFDAVGDVGKAGKKAYKENYDSNSGTSLTPANVSPANAKDAISLTGGE